MDPTLSGEGKGESSLRLRPVILHAAGIFASITGLPSTLGFHQPVSNSTWAMPLHLPSKPSVMEPSLPLGFGASWRGASSLLNGGSGGGCPAALTP